MPCPSAPTTCTVTLPLRKSIGAVRRDLASEKNGQAIRSWASRGAKPPGCARKRDSGALPESSDTKHAQRAGSVGAEVDVAVGSADQSSESTISNVERRIG